MEPFVLLLVIGAVGGLIRSFLGYRWQADAGEKFNYVKMGQSVVRAAISGTVIVMGTSALFNSPITDATYVQALVLAIGSDVLIKEGTAK